MNQTNGNRLDTVGFDLLKLTTNENFIRNNLDRSIGEYSFVNFDGGFKNRFWFANS